MSGAPAGRSVARGADAILGQVRGCLGVVDNALASHGRTSVKSYLRGLCGGDAAAFQRRDDFFGAVHDYTAPLLGKAVARRVADELETSPVVLTANHHGADFFAQSVQSSLLFAGREVAGGPAATVPVLAFGNVPMNNLTYPKGVLVYRTEAASGVPLKLPVFSNRFNRKMVSLVPAYDTALLGRTLSRVDGLCAKNAVSTATHATLRDVLEHAYGAPQALGQNSYSRQATLINGLVWKRLFAEPARAPEMVYLEIEQIVNRLLRRDLANPESLVWRVMFDARVREHVVQGLDGAKGCWDRQKLARRAVRHAPLEAGAAAGGGTLFFWGVGADGNRIPLLLDRSDPGSAALSGVDDKGRRWVVPFAPEHLTRGLEQGRVLPSLFTCFLVVALARGIKCLGGYYQADYLPKMQRAVSRALLNAGESATVTALIDRVPADGYLSGMQAVMWRAPNGGLFPAGPLEIIAGGGLTDDDLERTLELSVAEAHLASLFETVNDVRGIELCPTGGVEQLALECGARLKDRIVIK